MKNKTNYIIFGVIAAVIIFFIWQRSNAKKCTCNGSTSGSTTGGSRGGGTGSLTDLGGLGGSGDLTTAGGGTSLDNNTTAGRFILN